MSTDPRRGNPRSGPDQKAADFAAFQFAAQGLGGVDLGERQNQAIGRSKGGLTTKVLALVDGLGNLVRFCLLPGQRSEIVGVPSLIEGLNFDALLADKAFDADHLRSALYERGAKAVIPAKRNRITHIPHDEEMYKWRHLVENYFSKIKEFRSVNTRYDKTDTSYEATINIAASVIAMR